MEIKKILVPVDNSEYSSRALEYAEGFAKKMDSSILLLHCHHKYPSYLGEPFLQEAINRIHDKANMVLEPYRNFLKRQKVHFSERLLEEPVGEAITKTAKIENIDLIIMGTKGKTDLEGLLLGSVSHKVMHYAHCPVMIIR